MNRADDPKYIHLPNELFAPVATKHFSGEVALQTVEYESGNFEFVEPITYSIDITNASEGMYVSGSVQGCANTQCGRCLDDVSVDVFGNIQTLYLFEAPALGPDDYCDEEILSADHCICIYDLVLSAVLECLPTKVLCSEDCKGLCAKCGQNLNEGECRCAQNNEIDPNSPFSVLSDFKVED